MYSRFLSELLPSMPEPERKSERLLIADDRESKKERKKERGTEKCGRGEGGHGKEGVCARDFVHVIVFVRSCFFLAMQKKATQQHMSAHTHNKRKP